MTYDTIPIPQINFADEPEKEAEQLFLDFFKSDFNITYYIETAKDGIKSKLYQQESRDDKIVILSYLINKLTEKIYNLKTPRSDFERGIQERETKPTYKAMLHFLYRLIQNEGIEIPTDLFSKDEYNKSTQLLTEISGFLENKKVEYPNKAEAINKVQNKVKESKKFLFLGKEKWAELLMAAFLNFVFDKELTLLLPTVIQIITSYFKDMLKLN